MQIAIILWLATAVWLNCTGWLLSAVQQLNATGYLLALLPGLACALVWWRKNAGLVALPKYFRRFRRPLPAIFLFLSGLVFLGGILYAPSNYDGLTYRLPRMLNWLAAEKWIWISTVDDRLNIASPAWEWMAMPLFALARSDRGLFLINVSGFLLMPGLLFAIFRQLGVARKVAWTWMWLVPMGYGYITQAGSIGNDLTATIFFLIAIFFGLRARKSGRVEDVWLALLAAALMTGVKFSNLPLALPCLVAVWPALRQLPKKLMASVAVLGVAVMVSAMPTLLLNQQHTGSWTGDPKNITKMQVKNPAAALLGNTLLVLQQTFMPPVLPNPKAVNQWITRHLPEAWSDLLRREFPRYSLANLNELPMEEGSALGLGVTAALLIALATGLARPGPIRKLLPATVLAAWAATGVYMLKMGSEAAPRLLLPYYPLIIVPFLLLPVQRLLLQRRLWRIFLVLVGLSTLPAIVLSASHPLWPGRTFAAKMVEAYPDNPKWRRMLSVYSVYENRNDALAPVRNHLPPSADKISLITGSNDTTYSFWRPFGRRQVLELRPVDRQFHTPETEWLVVKDQAWTAATDVPLAEWALAHHATIVATTEIVQLVRIGPEGWTILHCEPH